MPFLLPFRLFKTGLEHDSLLGQIGMIGKRPEEREGRGTLGNFHARKSQAIIGALRRKEDHLAMAGMTYKEIYFLLTLYMV
jgi:hypothetical protein